MVLDFGMAGTVRLTTRFTDSNRMVDAVGAVVTSRSESGLGGALESVIGRLASLSLGAIELRQPVVSLARERTGGDAAPPYDGLIGIGVLRRFRVFFDQAGSRVALLPTARIPLPFVHAPSGATFAPLGTATRGLVVAAVAPGTPSASAGLQVGDRVLTVASRSAERWTRRDWQDAIDASDGRPLDVRVSRSGRSVELRLAAPRLLASASPSGTR
jgi:membrane-associated protease RseP (regulator of RpoE activity)